FALAANLCQEGHDVTVIDKDRSRLDIMEEHLNISTVHGNAAKLETLAEADAAGTDLIIAVTDKDELNMVTCFLARRAGVKSAVARVRAPGYSDLNNSAALSALGIDMLINPEKVTARAIGMLIDYPEANHVSYFGGGQIVMMEFRLNESCTGLGTPLSELRCPVPCIIMGIEHQGQLIIPRGNDRLSAGDDVLLLTAVKDARRVEEFLNIAPRHPHDISILGGSLMGYYLAEMLEKSDRHYNVKIFEPDRLLSEEMAQQFRHTTVINCSGEAAISMFDDENVGDSDLLIAASEDDKVNLFACVVADHLGAGKTISQVRGEYARLVEQTVATDKVVSPNRLTLNTILSFINRNRVLSLTRFVDMPGQITEFLVPEGAPAAGRCIKDIHMPLDALICMIIRKDKHMIPGGNDQILAGDSVIVFSLPEAMEKVEQLLTSDSNSPGRED
ncbi:MAG: Trk system potassium transporter TrkA, partial [Firmicutes bacterium]|nr:Trk system potassium transporter TrkA [Bacillota bacterium]